jgi:hypothetical protein
MDFHQTSLNFVGISTVVCGSFWGLKKIKMATIAIITKVQNMLNYFTWHMIFLQGFIKFDQGISEKLSGQKCVEE